MALDAGPEPFEAELVARARERSPEAWTAIYDACYRPIYRYVRARVFDESTASDIASAVFVEAIASIGSYQYRGKPLLAWLYRIARNLVSNHQRKLLRSPNGRPASAFDFPRRIVGRLLDRHAVNGDEGEAAAIAANGIHGDPGEMVEQMDLRHALQKLPPAQRDVLALRFLVGLTTPEIAAAMGKQPVAIYSLQARALVTIRKEMECAE